MSSRLPAAFRPAGVRNRVKPCSLAWATELRCRWYATPTPGTFLSTARPTSSMADGSLMSRYADWRGPSIRRKRKPPT